jgi:pyruvate ferredoxin oxidoreductase gamma subunit
MSVESELAARLERGGMLDLRGDGKAGGGLVLAVQAFGGSLAAAGFDVQDWPLFSSARKGANVRAYLRASRTGVEATCQVTRPDVAVLMNEAAGLETDFAEGTSTGVYVINTVADPDSAARRYRLCGTVATISGDALGNEHLGRPLGNIAVFAALVKVTGLAPVDVARKTLESTLKKRRLPQRVITANLAMFEASLEKVRSAEIPSNAETDHRRAAFKGYGALPPGAQAALRSSVKNRTSGYGRPGVKVVFSDPTSRCNGCSLCVVQCPDGLMEFIPDPLKGTMVYGAKFDDHCKVCRECVNACPLNLFSEISLVARPAETLEGGA